MRSFALFTFVLSSVALAQPNALFGSGKPPLFAEQDLDRRFGKSKLARALSNGTEDSNCAQLLGGLFMVMAESAPYIHKRDENLYIDSTLWQATAAHLSSPRFPAQNYLVAMMRRVLIDGKLPTAWMATAQKVNATVGFIDLGKLQLLMDGVKPIDSWAFTIPALRERYALEVIRANALTGTSAEAAFRDTYLDRDVLWGGLTLIDVGPEKKPAPPKKKKKKSKEEDEPPPEPADIIAVMHWTPPDPNQGTLSVFAPVKVVPTTIIARLSPEQYANVHKLPRGSRVMVRGRFWEMNKNITKLEVRDALIFLDRDYSAGVVLADPQAIARCPFAVNEMSGTAPVQPGGFSHGR